MIFANRPMYKILISPGSFKDVFSPDEIAKVLSRSVKKIARKKILVSVAPLVDGGEYSSEVLFHSGQYKRMAVKRVISSTGKAVRSGYLVRGGSAYIFTSDILRLGVKEDILKNPTVLTSFGMGQLISHAIKSGYKNLVIGLGGTNTVDGGIGLAQALGVKFLDDDGNKLKPLSGEYFCGQDMSNVREVEYSDSLKKIKNLKITVLCDSQITIFRLRDVTKLKIGAEYQPQKLKITEDLQKGLINYAKIVNEHKAKGINLIKLPGYGNAGGILLSLRLLFDLKTEIGADYFIRLLNVEKEVKDSDMVITGEGRLDESSLLGKSPVRISQISKRYRKQTVFVCGDVFKKYRKKIKDSVCFKPPLTFRKNGINILITFFDKYPVNIERLSYQQLIKMYKRIMLKNLDVRMKDALNKIIK